MLADLKYILHPRKLQLHVDMVIMQQMHHCTVARDHTVTQHAVLDHVKEEHSFPHTVFDSPLIVELVLSPRY